MIGRVLVPRLCLGTHDAMLCIESALATAMKPSVYLETTIPSYLAAWTSPEVVMAARQQITREWWDSRERFDLYVSQLVLDEVSAGDPDAAQRRLELIEGIPLVGPTEEMDELVEALLSEVPLPPIAGDDAAHIAIAVVNGLDYLLTWNCRYIANAALRSSIESVCRSRGFEPPVTPEELMQEQDQ